MEKRRIGSLEVSLVGLGCNNFGGRIDARQSRAVVDAAVAAGITFFDTADIYAGTRSEEILGESLVGKRDQVVVATKFGMALDDRRKGAHPDYIRRAVEDSLRRLRTDRIDLYQLHEPDPTVPIADTLGALGRLVETGKVLEIGCSNFSVAQLRAAAAAGKSGEAGFVSVQNEYSLLVREPEQGVLQECAQEGLAFLPFFPLASGLLTGKYLRGKPAPQGARLAAEGAALTSRFMNDVNIETAEALAAFAAGRGHTPLELAFSWLAAREVVASVIAGATRPEQVEANVSAVGWRLSAQDLTEIDRIAPVR